jgi:hypothetical protein
MTQRQFQRILAVLLFVFALVPRLQLSGAPITIDETVYWTFRSEHFLEALRTGDLAQTVQAYHPGVTTMWLGAAGLVLQEAVETITGSGLAYMDARPLWMMPVMAVNALSVVVGFFLLKRLFDFRVALLASLFWAAEPFLVAHAQVLHVDALTTSFMTLSFLAGLIALRLDDDSDESTGLRRGWLVGSAGLGGLAALTKVTALFVWPALGLVALVALWQPERPFRALPIMPMLSWLIIALIVWLGLYPAAWTSLGAVVERLLDGVGKATTAHETGNFFLGRTVDDPGLLFYPLAILLRMTPWVMLGVIVAVFSYRPQTRAGRLIGWLLLYCALFIIVMAVQPKKFDRYMLPLFPIFAVLAAYGWLHLIDWLPKLGLPAPVVWLGGAVLLWLNLLLVYPYPLAYYNPMLGGGRTAANVLLVGWGEGLDQAAAYVSARMDDCSQQVMSAHEPVVQRYLGCHWARPIYQYDRDYENLMYVILYIDQIQRNATPELTTYLQTAHEPAHIVRIHGIDYAYIYDVTAISLPAEVAASMP